MKKIMVRHDWYRNEQWNKQIEEDFFARLNRARKKGQYLRIHANYLAKTYPDIALSLLERYFKLKDNFDLAQAYVDMANAYIAKNDFNRAISCYEAALAREEDFPNLQTEAYIKLPFLIVSIEKKELYPYANMLLDKFIARLTFPLEFFGGIPQKPLYITNQIN